MTKLFLFRDLGGLKRLSKFSGPKSLRT